MALFGFEMQSYEEFYELVYFCRKMCMELGGSEKLIPLLDFREVYIPSINGFRYYHVLL